MKTHIHSIIFLIVMLLGNSLKAQVFTLEHHNKSPQIDGILNEEIWNDIAVLTDFKNHYPSDEGNAHQQTEVRMFHDGQSLYIGAIYHDNDDKNNISSLKRDQYTESMFQSDCLGIVFDPYQEGNNGYYFGLNAAGVQFDALIGNINQLNSSWNAVWFSAVSQIGNDKYYEISIPLNAINFDPSKSTWGVQLFVNDSKKNIFSTLVQSPRNFRQYDLRYMLAVEIIDLPQSGLKKYAAVPSITFNTQQDHIADSKSTQVIPSLDVQYNITQSLRMDATLNPDFSQVEVDRQVTNLTRFAINFPERRKFFLENSDLFTNLGTGHANPFYSRRIGSESDIIFGGKLSGNVGANTRIGVLNAQTKNQEDVIGKNYTVLVGRQNISNSFNATGFLVNSQNDQTFNRVGGGIVNFKSKNNKWIAAGNYSESFNPEIQGNNNFYHAGAIYNTRKFDATASYQKIGRNYIAETGFVPMLYNYDARDETVTREGFQVTFVEAQLKHIPKSSQRIDWMRRFWVYNQSVFNEDNSLRESFTFFSPFAIRFKNTGYVYVAFGNTRENLEYNFDFLQNGAFIEPGSYNYTFGRTGYWSPTNRDFQYATRFEYGQFYDGMRANAFVTVTYRLLPTAILSSSYEINTVDLNELGKRTFHLARLTTEIYFSNQLNWTTYIQYNTQQDNLNVNSRIQWEYKPLSYVYLVLSNNYNERILQKNWGLSVKVNRRLDF